MTQILVFKPGLIGQAERDALIAAGVVPIETPDPAGVRLIEAEGSQLGGGDLLYAALKGCQTHQWAKERFAETMMALMEAARSKPTIPAFGRDAKGRFVKPP